MAFDLLELMAPMCRSDVGGGNMLGLCRGVLGSTPLKEQREVGGEETGQRRCVLPTVTRSSYVT